MKDLRLHVVVWFVVLVGVGSVIILIAWFHSILWFHSYQIKFLTPREINLVLAGWIAGWTIYSN